MDMAEFLAARSALLTAPYSYEALVAYSLEYGNVPPPERLGEVVFHKARVNWRDCPPDLAEQSREWLARHGFRSGA
jgi:hypothetical protein